MCVGDLMCRPGVVTPTSLIFIDNLSRYGYVYLIKHKSEAFERFKKFRHEVEKQTGKSVKVL